MSNLEVGRSCWNFNIREGEARLCERGHYFHKKVSLSKKEKKGLRTKDKKGPA